MEGKNPSDVAAIVRASSAFKLGDCEIDPSTGLVKNADETVRLQPQAVEVLIYLTSHYGRVVSRDEIEDAVWPDRTVGYDALTGTMFKLRKALGDDPKKPTIIETLPKRGYRLLVPAEPLTKPRSAELPASLPKRSPLRSYSMASYTGYVAAAVGLLLLIGIAAVYLSGQRGSLHDASLPAHQASIVVLPFKSLNTHLKNDHFADGLTDDLTTALAKYRGLLVIARDSAFRYKGDKLSDSEIARRLKVNYVLRGSVRLSADQVRINAHLLDVSSGQQVWAERYDGRIHRIFDLQDKIVSQISSALALQVSSLNKSTMVLPRTASPRAYDSFLLGRQHFYQFRNKVENHTARLLFQKALEYDPNFALAYAMLGWTHAFDAMNGWTKDRGFSLDQGEKFANKAAKIQENIPLVYFVRGLVFRERGEYVKAMVEAEKAIALDSNYANAHVLNATLLYYAGRPEESIGRLRRAMRINPHHPFNYTFHLGQAYFVLKKYDQAVQAFNKGLDSNPSSERLHVWLGASYALSGNREDAKWHAEQAIVLNPSLSLETLKRAYPFKSVSDKEHFLEGLRRAGFPG